MEETEILILKNDLSQLSVLSETLERLFSNGRLPGEHLFNINLALDELVTNIILYGYGDKIEHEIVIRFIFSDSSVEIAIEDDGKPFDPLSIPDPDVTLPAEQRQIGGLGIFFVKKLMDSIEYRRTDNKNILKIIKIFH